MRTVRHLLSVILVVTILLSGLPIFSPEDANRDSKVTLQDAILHMRDFVQTADQPAAFTSNVKKVLSALRVVVGLKTEIRPEKDAQASPSLFSLDAPYLISLANSSVSLSKSFSRVYEEPFFYKSVELAPPFPPPKTA